MIKFIENRGCSFRKKNESIFDTISFVKIFVHDSETKNDKSIGIALRHQKEKEIFIKNIMEYLINDNDSSNSNKFEMNLSFNDVVNDSVCRGNSHYFYFSDDGIDNFIEKITFFLDSYKYFDTIHITTMIKIPLIESKIKKILRE